MKNFKIFISENEDLERFRQQALKDLKKESSFIKKVAEDVLNMKVIDVKPIGSVISKSKFTEHSDVDVGIWLKRGSKNVDEKLSQKLQMEMIGEPIGDIGVVNTVVFN